MELNKLFDMIEEARESANWRAAFGEPEVVDDKTIIPVAQVTHGFGLGYGIGAEPTEAVDEASPTDAALSTDEVAPGDVAEGGGGGGGAQVRPLGAIIVTPEYVYVEEVADSTKVSLAGILMGAWVVYQFAKTLRAIFGRE